MAHGGTGRRASPAFAAAIVLGILAAGVAAGQSGFISVTSPSMNQGFAAGDTITVLGEVQNFNGTPLSGVPLIAYMVDFQNSEVPGTRRSGTSQVDGSFTIAVDVPVSLAPGGYVLRVESSDPQVFSTSVALRVRAPVSAFESPGWIAALLVLGSAAGAATVVILLRRMEHRPSAK